MSGDAVELANELYERFGALTKERALKIAAAERLPTNPIPAEAVTRAVEQAAVQVLSEYPLEDGTAAGWDALYARKPSFAHILDGLFLATMKARGGEVSEPTDALPIGDAATLSASNAGEEAEPATPDREALAQYIGLGFSLYSQCETQDGKRKFCDWQGGREWNKDTARIARLEELDAALKAGIRLFSFLPSEKGFVCFDVDIGHSSGKDGFKSIERFLKRRGLTVNLFMLAVVTVDTPSGGKHLYFRDWTAGTSKYEKEPLKGVEVFGAGSDRTLTAAGSVRNGKAYALHGKLEGTTLLPNALVDHIREKKGGGANRGPQYPQYPTKSNCSHTGKKSRGDYPLERLVEWGIENANSDSRDINAFYIGLSVGSAYPLSEVKAACYRNAKFADRRDFSDSELEYQLNRGIAKSDFK